MMLDKGPDLYLASASPRRRELLRQIGMRFEIIDGLSVDESSQQMESPADYVCRLACAKAHAGYTLLLQDQEKHHYSGAPVLGADTCVAVDDEILVKPADRDDCIAMLQRLSGRSHEVLTAICLYDGKDGLQSLSRSVVTFKKLDISEIKAYWDSGEPHDKAGGYAIQGYAATFVCNLRGSYSGVVGLPLYELAELLQSRDQSE